MEREESNEARELGRRQNKQELEPWGSDLDFVLKAIGSH